jgi:enediyne biosynthesis protein CalE3
VVYLTRASRLMKYHGAMLADSLRVEAFRGALEKTVRPGDVVIDLGCGTGVLAFLAAKLGAKKVYAIEVSEIIETAKTIRIANRLQHVVELIPRLSYLTALPERADVIVSETLGNFGLDEGIVGSIGDARARLLKDGGRIIPRAIEILAAPMESPDLHAHVGAFRSDLFDLDFSSVRPYAASLMVQARVDPSGLLAEPAMIGRFDLQVAGNADLRTSATFRIVRSGVLHGIAGWFRAQIVDGIELTNAPVAAKTSWQQMFLPLEVPVTVRPGDSVSFSLEISDNGGQWIWRIGAGTGGG